jgi:thiol-disulfide isomerase/thioredoxin
MHLKITLFCVLLLSFSYASHAQTGYNLKFNIQGWQDTTVYLGHYYGESTYIKDTARVNNKGEFFFDGKQALPPGVYMLILDKSKIFDFVIGKQQFFSINTKSDDYIKHLKVTGDIDNEIFFQNMLFNADRHAEAEPFIKVLQDSTISDELKKKEAREGFSKINEKVVQYQKQIIEKHPTTTTAALFKSNIAVEVPEPPKRSDGTIDSTFQLKWYRQHYFDNFDLSNEALIRMPRPMYSEKVNEYLDRLYAPHADSLTPAIKYLVSKAKATQETYKYMVGVYVFLYDNYIANGDMDFWMNSTYKKNVKEYVDRLRKSLIGQQGANLIMLDQNLKQRSMYDIKNKYTILYFYDPDCGHCRKETPKLVEFYNKNKTKLDVEVFAVSADTSMAKMNDFIRDMKATWISVNGPRTFVGPYGNLYDAITTPTLYVLDQRKRIIGKKVPIEKLEDFLLYQNKLKK